MSDFVLDDEILYRRVTYDKKNWAGDNKDNLRVQRSAFSDRNKQPSVDRAKLCGFNPSHTQAEDIRNGVVSLVTGEVRMLGLRHEKEDFSYKVDVVHKPEKNNVAHAEVTVDPEITSDNVFKRLREMLTRLANQRGWLIFPDGFRN